jgi:putative membrane protein
MTKKSEFDFSVPHRQSYAAIVMILGRSLNIVMRQLFPVFIVIFLGSSQNRDTFLIYVGVATALITLSVSLVNYFVTYFYIKNNELIFHTGVFTKKKTALPFDRIQTVHFEQNIFHTIFSVVKLNIDSAGSDKNEFQFHALDTAKAKALRDTILQGQSQKYPHFAEETDKPSTEKTEKIISLSVRDLLRAGFTENHIKSGGLIIFFFFWIYNNLKDAGVDVEEYTGHIPGDWINFSLLLSLASLFLLISVSISLFRTVVVNFNLSMFRTSAGFKILHGLFTRKETSARDHKIQYISWSDNLLKKLIGFYNLYIHQASPGQLKLKENIRIPGVRKTHIHALTTYLYGMNETQHIPLRSVRTPYFARFAMIIMMLSVVSVAGIYLFSQPIYTLYPVIISLFLVLLRFISFRKKKYGLTGDMLFLKGGTFGDKYTLMPVYKIQAAAIHQSWYQWRHQLCDVKIFTASGPLVIPYISLGEGYTLVQFLTYSAETDKRPWM